MCNRNPSSSCPFYVWKHSLRVQILRHLEVCSISWQLWRRNSSLSAVSDNVVSSVCNHVSFDVLAPSCSSVTAAEVPSLNLQTTKLYRYHAANDKVSGRGHILHPHPSKPPESICISCITELRTLFLSLCIICSRTLTGNYRLTSDTCSFHIILSVCLLVVRSWSRAFSFIVVT